MTKRKYIREDQSDKLKWLTFYPEFKGEFIIEKAGYYDERPVLTTTVTQLLAVFAIPILCYFSLYALLLLPLVFYGFGFIFINLPIKTGVNECESDRYGFVFHDNLIFIHYGSKIKTLSFPWDKVWISDKYLMDDGSLFAQNVHKRLDWAEDKECVKVGSHDWLLKNVRKYPFDYVDFDGDIVKATAFLEVKEWRYKILKWTSLFSIVKKYLNVHFEKEVGKNKGSFKGCLTSCSVLIRGSETVEDCLKRFSVSNEVI